MNYQELIETVSLMVETEKICKVGLTMQYELEATEHDRINRELFHKSNPYSVDFQSSDEFEVMLGGILIKFVKKK